MKKIYYLTKHFLRVFVAYRINFLALLIIPIVSIIYQQSDQVFQSIPIVDYYSYLSLWLAYIVTVSTFAIGYEIVILREQQFLKQMQFITRDHRFIISAKILTHFILLFFTVFLLALISQILFAVPFFSVLSFSIGFVSLPFLPLSFLFLILNLLPMHTENLQPIITFTTMAMLFYLNFLDFFNQTTTLLVMLNPMNFALEAGKIWGGLYLSGIQVNTFAVTVTGGLYLILGCFAMKNTRIVANFRM